TVSVSGINKSTATEISFVNLLGQKIFEGTVANGINQMNISTLNAGLYLAEININCELYSLKFIKN
ncbi:MAG: T9SS C-terminal target domain-containing protein, partial [Sphingobacteriales bacterium]